MQEKDILFESGLYWVMKSKQHKGFDIYKTGVTHSTRVAQIGYEGHKGLDKAKEEINRRQALDLS